MKVDSSGSLYIADTRDYRVRYVSKATGDIWTIAGTGAVGCSGSQGPATSALFTSPSRLAVDGSGNVYVSDASCGAIYKLTPVRSAYTGNLDAATCQTIAGWAADTNRLNQSLTVSIYDGTTYLTNVTANLSRPDIATLLGDNGLHGFSYTLPTSLGTGAHNIHVYYESSSIDTGSSPQALTCGGVKYTGNIDSSSCSGISGWAADRNRPNTSITVTLWDGTTQIASTIANASRPDVGTFLGDNGLHGFMLPIPSAYKNVISHTLQVHYESSSTQLGAPVTLSCGGLGRASRISPARSTPPLAAASTAGSRIGIGRIPPFRSPSGIPPPRIAATTANASRPDVGTFLGDNGLHGFSLQLPPAYANGVATLLQLHYEGTPTQVPGSPFTLTCGSSGGGGGSVNYAGAIDSSSCSGISGWVADRNRLNTSITVSLWDGSSQIASTTANGSRPDVGTFLGDNGLHGFTLQLPSSYSNGVSHTLQVHYESSTPPWARPSCSPAELPEGRSHELRRLRRLVLLQRHRRLGR